MLGHLQPQSCSLSEPAQHAYNQFYCGICKSLRKEKGLSASLMINHELSLNLLALSPYMEGATTLSTPCPSSGFLKQKSTINHLTVNTAAKLSVLLGWIKSVDWAFDSKSKLASLIEKKLSKWKKDFTPSFSNRLQAEIEDYLFQVKNHSPEAKIVKLASASLAEKLWLELADQTQIPIQQKDYIKLIFSESGKLIYLADALEDLQEDKRKSQYNPILDLQKKSKISLELSYEKYYQEYLLHFFNIKTLLGRLASLHPQHLHFISVFNSSLTHVYDKVKNKRLELTGVEQDLDFFQSTIQFFSNIDFQAAKCPCDQCCKGCTNCGNCCHNAPNCCGSCCKGCGDGCKLNCDNCCNHCCECRDGCCDCGNCCNNGCKDCTKCGGNCGNCCGDTCDFWCDVCRGDNSSTHKELNDSTQYMEEFKKQLDQSDLADDKKEEMLRKIDSLMQQNNHNIEDALNNSDSSSTK